MKFGVREICNVVFRATQAQKIGNKTFQKGQPVFYIDSAKTSTVEGAATTVYATGGRGNARLIAWEGEKTLTFTVEDALLSPISFAMLSGAGLIKGLNDSEFIHFHQTTMALVGADGTINLTNALEPNERIDDAAPLYVLGVDEGGDLTGNVCRNCSLSGTKTIITSESDYFNKTVMVDYYVLKPGTTVSELQIDAENFAGYYYVEADTLFRRQNDGKDLPANLTLPNVKIQSNFTFAMASSGDPSTFTFTMDAFPGYTYFDTTKKVLCAIQIVDDISETTIERDSVFKHEGSDSKVEGFNDSIPSTASSSFANAGVIKKGTTELASGDTVNPTDELTITGTGNGVTYVSQYKKSTTSVWTPVENGTIIVPSETSETTPYVLNVQIIASKGGEEIVKNISLNVVAA